MVAPSLTPDGKYLVYISPALPTLYDPSDHGWCFDVQDVALELPARTISPRVCKCLSVAQQWLLLHAGS